MKRFVIFVEGQTEQAGIKAFLARWFEDKLTHPVCIEIVLLKGWSRLVKRIRSRIEDLSDDADIIAFVGLMDLWGPDFYPDPAATASERAKAGALFMCQEVQNPRFSQYFAVHEIEAWFISQPEKLPKAVREALKNKAKRPETINSSEPPSKLLDSLYVRHLNKHYIKTIEGRNLFRSVDPNIAYAKCPHLKIMLDEMLSLAKAAGL